MTPIRYAVKRKTEQLFRHTGRPIVVSIEPGDLIGMRLKGMRTTYRSTIESVFIFLAGLHARAEQARKKAEQKAKKAAT